VAGTQATPVLSFVVVPFVQISSVARGGSTTFNIGIPDKRQREARRTAGQRYRVRTTGPLWN
jgi:hypothetical protein